MQISSSFSVANVMARMLWPESVGMIEQHSGHIRVTMCRLAGVV